MYHLNLASDGRFCLQTADYGESADRGLPVVKYDDGTWEYGGDSVTLTAESGRHFRLGLSEEKGRLCVRWSGTILRREGEPQRSHIGPHPPLNLELRVLPTLSGEESPKEQRPETPPRTPSSATKSEGRRK